MTAEMATALSALAVIWFAAVVTPGPNFIAILHMAASERRAAALATAGGVGLGTFIWAASGVFGLKALFTLLPAAALAIKLAGGAYLVWIGIKLWQSAAPLAATNAIGKPEGTTLSAAFRFGLFTNLANPKTAVFAASLFAVAVPPGQPLWFAWLTIGLIVTISIAWYSALASIGALPVFSNAYRGAKRILLRITGALFIGYGVKLIVSGR